MANKKKSSKKRGPKQNHLQIDDNWENAAKKAIQKKKPLNDYPEKVKRGRKSK